MRLSAPLPAPATVLLLALGAAKLAAHLATAHRYGYHRDELYYLACGARPAWGYVDHPPLTPLVARAADLAFGGSLVGLRAPAMLAGAVTVALVGLTARELGGGRFAQGLAAFAALVCPFLLAAGGVLQTVAFDVLVWTTATYLAARLLRTGRAALWLPLGFVFGVGLLTKYTVGLLGAGLALGLVVTHERRWLASPRPWASAALALGLGLPTLVWQATHGWPFLDFARANSAEVRAEETPLGLLAEQVLLLGPPQALLWAGGVFALLRATWARPFRALGVTALTVLGALVVLEMKPYYLGGLYGLGLAAGAVGVERRAARRPVWRPGALALVGVGALVTPVVLPVLPVGTMVRLRLHTLNENYAEMLGWPEFVRAIAQAYGRLTPEERSRATILTANYGEAGALERWGSPYGLPSPISAHNSYWTWGSRGRDGAVTIVTGYSGAWVRAHFAEVERAGVVRNRWGVANEEAGQAVWIARRPRRSLSAAWPELRHFN